MLLFAAAVAVAGVCYQSSAAALAPGLLTIMLSISTSLSAEFSSFFAVPFAFFFLFLPLLFCRSCRFMQLHLSSACLVPVDDDGLFDAAASLDLGLFTHCTHPKTTLLRNIFGSPNSPHSSKPSTLRQKLVPKMSTDVSAANKRTNQDKSEYGAPPARGVAALHQRDANTTTLNSTVTPHGGKKGRSSTPQTPCCTSEGPTPQCGPSSTTLALESMQARRIENTRSMKAEKGWIKATSGYLWLHCTKQEVQACCCHARNPTNRIQHPSQPPQRCTHLSLLRGPRH